MNQPRQNFMAGSPERISEAELAKQLGVPRAALRGERPQADVGAIGKLVSWTKKAAMELANRLDLDPPIAEKTPPHDVGEMVTVCSTVRLPGGRHFPNARLIQAVRENGEKIFVRVASPSRYAPTLRDGAPMRFRAVPAHGGNWWILLDREPRFIRQW